MKIRLSLLLLLLSTIYSLGYTQPNIPLQIKSKTKEYTRLKIGDKIPEDFVFENMINYPGGKAKMSDFKGKAVILDFWNMACSPCIGGFPKMEQFQAKYGDKLQILLVNILNTLNTLEENGFPKKTKSPIIPLIKLPFALNTRDITAEDIGQGKMALWELFPHAAEPYHAWIDDQGIFRGETRGADVTEKNIEYFLVNKKLLSDKPVLLPEDLGITENNKNQSFLHPNNTFVKEGLLYSSVITKSFGIGKGLGEELLDNATGNLTGIRTDHSGILQLYIRHAFFGTLSEKKQQEMQSMIRYNQIVLDVANPEVYIPPKDADSLRSWKGNNLYVYELMLPASKIGNSRKETKLKISRFMLQDLERFFGIKGFIEKRKVRCWVLSRTSEIDKVNTKGEKMDIQETREKGLILNNCPLLTFMEKFVLSNGNQIPIIPFVNETGFDQYKKRIDLKFDFPLNDTQKVKQVLSKHDLSLSLEDREIEVLVISDKEEI